MSNLNQTLKTSEVIWHLSDLYEDNNDPKLEEDIQYCLNLSQELYTEYSDRVANLSAPQIFQLVETLEKIANVRGKFATFAFLQFTTDTNNAESGAFLQRVRELGSQISQKTVFFDLEWSQIKEDRASQLLSEDVLTKYRHYLISLRRYAPHLLSKTEENILIETAPVGRGSWTNLFEKVMGQLKFGPNGRTEEEVLSDLYNQNQTVRKTAAKELSEGLTSQIHVLTHITNTLLAEKMIDDRIRNYPSWVSSMNLYNELSDETVDTLIEAVTSRYDLVQRYYQLKKKTLQVDILHDYDRYAPMPNLPGKLVPWQDCHNIVIDTFTDFSPEFGSVAEQFFSKKWIHAPILEGKRGGAFAHPCTPDVHPYVLVNYTGNMRDVSTVAHELGHGVHQYLAAKQGYLNSDTPLVLAETASVFAELLVFQKQLKLIQKEGEKKAFIAQKIESIFATVFRQIAMNRFEHKSHSLRRERGELSTDELSSFWLETQQEMFGDSVNLTNGYAIWWSYIPHFLNTPGYVYSYAFGELLVLSLYKIYLKDEDAFVQKYTNLLASGGSQSPQDLLKPFDIDLTQKEFWHGGLSFIDDMIRLLEE